MYITTLPPLSPLHRTSHFDGVNIAKQLPGHALFFKRGRQALMAGIAHLELKPGSTVMIPSNICREVLVPFILNGIRVRYYRLMPDTRIDMDDLASKIDETVSAVYIYHYLGMPCANIVDAVSLLKTRNIPVIEDCAHGFLGTLNGQKLGSFGDIAIFSLWKFMPVPDGGALIINDTTDTQQSRLLPTRSGYADAIKSWIKGRLKSLPPFRHSDFPDVDDNIGNIGPIEPKPISRLSLAVLDHADYNAIRNERVENYAFWHEALPDFMTPYFNETPVGFCPYAFPFRVHNREIQRNLYTGMAKRGIMLEPPINPDFTGHTLIDVATWPKNPDCDLVLCLPVYQGLTPAQKRYILSSLI